MRGEMVKGKEWGGKHSEGEHVGEKGKEVRERKRKGSYRGKSEGKLKENGD